jgi:outer membrane protein assembly factor BamB
VAFCNHDRLHVAALSFDDGHLVWEQAPGGFVSRHGFHTCPVLSKGRLFLSGQQDSDDAFVAMLDARTGRLAWKVPRGKAGRSFSTPFLFSAGGDEQLVLSGTEETIGYRTGDGSMLWRVDGPAEKTVSSLVVGRDLIFVAGGRDKRLFALRPADAGGGAEIVWQASKGIPYVSSPVLADGILHIVSDDGIYSRYRPEDGTLLLQKRLGDRTSSSLVAAAGRVYLTDETGRTTVVTSGARFEVLATNELSEGVRASLAVSNGELFIRGNRHLFCISDRDASDSRSGGAASSSRSQ